MNEVSETPRTDKAYFETCHTKYDLAGEMKNLERELNESKKQSEEAWKLLQVFMDYLCDEDDDTDSAYLALVREWMENYKK